MDQLRLSQISVVALAVANVCLLLLLSRMLRTLNRLLLANREICRFNDELVKALRERAK